MDRPNGQPPPPQAQTKPGAAAAAAAELQKLRQTVRAAVASVNGKAKAKPKHKHRPVHRTPSATAAAATVRAAAAQSAAAVTNPSRPNILKPRVPATPKPAAPSAAKPATTSADRNAAAMAAAKATFAQATAAAEAARLAQVARAVEAARYGGGRAYDAYGYPISNAYGGGGYGGYGAYHGETAAQRQQRLAAAKKREAERLQREKVRLQREKERREAEEDREIGQSHEVQTFEEYQPEKITIGKPHPDPVVHTSSMSSVSPPDPDHRLALPIKTIEGGHLSNLQLESIVYASTRHKRHLPNGCRAGFLLGDGAGVGKGRQIAGTVWENFIRGRTKALWFSASADLHLDARRDFADIGATGLPIFNLREFGANENLSSKKGILFCTYSLLATKKSASARQSRYEQILEFLGPDFEGCMIFDESHKAKHYYDEKQMQNKNVLNNSKSTATARCVLQLQDDRPEARVVYVSATGASNLHHMAYMDRLGLWGEGTAFPNVKAFIQQVAHRGVGAMELVAMDMKSKGMFLSRTLSYRGAEYQLLKEPIPDSKKILYDNCCAFMAALLRGVKKMVMDIKSLAFVTDADAKKIGNAARQFWGMSQRFWRQLILAFKVDATVRIAKEALKEGKCVVIGLQSTGEARMKGKVASGFRLDEWVSSVREIAAHYITDQFRTGEEYPGGHAVPHLVALKAGLLKRAQDLDLPSNPLDELIHRLGGPKKVAEMTGRSMRMVKQSNGKLTMESRVSESGVDTVNIEERERFQQGKKLVGIISEAASTGVSLQADRRVVNRRRRVHITMELPWSADKTTQQLGRTHRSNQESAPIYKLLLMDIGGQWRLASAVAARLEALGALTQGDRRSNQTSSSLKEFDIENKLGEKALFEVMNTLKRLASGTYGSKESPVTQDFITEQYSAMQFGTDAVAAFVTSGIADHKQLKVKTFLNRIFGIELDLQAKIFQYFHETFLSIVDDAIRKGTYSDGIIDLKAESVKLVEGYPKVVYVDVNGGKTLHYKVKCDRGISWETAVKRYKDAKGMGLEPRLLVPKNVVAEKRGIIALAIPVRGAGGTYRRSTLQKPNVGFAPRTLDVWDIKKTYRQFELGANKQGDKVLKAKWVKLYDTHLDKCMHKDCQKPKGECTYGQRLQTYHLLGGSVMSVWDNISAVSGRFDDRFFKIVRVETEDGQRIVGIQVPDERITKMLDSIKAVPVVATHQERAAAKAKEKGAKGAGKAAAEAGPGDGQPEKAPAAVVAALEASGLWERRTPSAFCAYNAPTAVENLGASMSASYVTAQQRRRASAARGSVSRLPSMATTVSTSSYLDSDGEEDEMRVAPIFRRGMAARRRASEFLAQAGLSPTSSQETKRQRKGKGKAVEGLAGHVSPALTRQRSSRTTLSYEGLSSDSDDDGDAMSDGAGAGDDPYDPSDPNFEMDGVEAAAADASAMKRIARSLRPRRSTRGTKRPATIVEEEEEEEEQGEDASQEEEEEEDVLEVDLTVDEDHKLPRLTRAASRAAERETPGTNRTASVARRRLGPSREESVELGGALADAPSTRSPSPEPGAPPLRMRRTRSSNAVPRSPASKPSKARPRENEDAEMGSKQAKKRQAKRSRYSKPRIAISGLKSGRTRLKEQVTALGATIVDVVDDNTTHVVCEDKRTLKVLEGIVRGKWIVGPGWVEACHAAKQWVSEHPYEQNDAFPGAKVRREAAEQGHKGKLMAGKTVFVKPGHAHFDELVALVKVSGAKLTDDAKKASVVIDERRMNQSSTYLFNCVSQQTMTPV